jgi:CheY-like chemotaxis protein
MCRSLRRTSAPLPHRSPGAADAWPASMTHVLLAEDDHEVRRLLAGALRQQGYRITEADSGPTLLEQLWKRAASKSSFDLIISDIRLPGITGLEVLQALRTRADPRDEYRPQLHETPIILITAFGDAEVHRGAARLGAIVFDKPFEIDDLSACAQRLVPANDDEFDDAITDPYNEDGGSD